MHAPKRVYRRKYHTQKRLKIETPNAKRAHGEPRPMRTIGTIYFSSSSVTIWLTTLGLPWPRISFMTWPTKKPESPFLPPL